MKPFASRFTVPLYFVSAIFMIWGISMRLVPNANMDHIRYILSVGFLLSLVFMVLSIREVLSSDRISKNERRLWVLGLVLFNLIAGLAYSVAARERIVD